MLHYLGLDVQHLVPHYLAMATRMDQPVVRRPSVPLTARDEADLAMLKASPTYRRALDRLCASPVTADDDIGESVLLHALIEAGFAAVRLEAEEAGYRELAIDYMHQANERRSLARRRTPAWADET